MSFAIIYEARGQNRFTLYLSCDIVLMTRNLQKDSDNKRGVFYFILLVLKCFTYFIIVLASSFCCDRYFLYDCEGLMFCYH